MQTSAVAGVIGLYDHEIYCIIGVNPEERLQEQYLFVDLEVGADFERCAKTDNVEDTVSYTQLAKVCTRVAVEGRYQLLEAFANAVIDAIFKEYPVSWVRIKIRKPQALSSARYAAIELERKRDEASQ